MFRFKLGPKVEQQINHMKKIICILACAALVGACEQKTDVVVPASSPAPEKKVENSDASVTKKTREKVITTTDTANTLSLAPAASTETKTESSDTATTLSVAPATTTETKTESTTTTSSPSP